MRISTFLLLLAFAAGASAATTIEVPEGFVLQRLDATDGRIAKPRDWFYSSAGTPSGWVWTLSKEDPAKGPYKTGMKIQMLLGVEKGTGESRERFALNFIDEKRASTKLIVDCPKEDIGEFFRQCIEVLEDLQVGGKAVPFRILYSVMWGKTMDMVVMSTFGAPPDAWNELAPTANRMSKFMLIGPDFGK
jgi:hypothetical protein